MAASDHNHERAASERKIYFLFSVRRLYCVMFGPVAKQPKSYFMLIILSRYKAGILSLFL